MFPATDLSLPADDLVHLSTVFNALGRQRFGFTWAEDMAATVRVGQRSKNKDLRTCGQWALKALTQCVENGWLPLIYFVDGRRVRYFESTDGPALHALYPKPTCDEAGQVELAGGDIYPCMVDASGLAGLLRTKFLNSAASKRGRPPQYTEIDEVLERYFADASPDTPNGEVIRDIGRLVAEEKLPKKTTLHDRINKAKERAKARLRSGN
jgi:hypothetical protein